MSDVEEGGQREPPAEVIGPTGHVRRAGSAGPGDAALAGRAAWSPVARVGAAVAVLWLLVFAKVGSATFIGVDDLAQRSAAFPRLRISGDPGVDYRNWSILPLALGRVVGAGGHDSFAAVQCAVLLAGTIGVLAWTARRRPRVAAWAAMGLFASMVPAWALASVGSYDQLLAVLLVAAAVADAPAAGCAIGVLLGATHAEAGAIGVLGLAALAAAGIGPRLAVRWWTLGGVLATRAALTVWFRIAGQTDDRFTFVEEFGLGKLLGFFADTWPTIVWSAASGGWLLLVGAIVLHRSRPVTLAIVAALVLNVVTTAITADQSRVIMLTTLPLVVALAAFGEPPPAATDAVGAAAGAGAGETGDLAGTARGGPETVGELRDEAGLRADPHDMAGDLAGTARAGPEAIDLAGMAGATGAHRAWTLVRGGALLVGLAAPLTISWVGAIAALGTPFEIHW